MQPIPDWYLILTAIFFTIGIGVLVGLGVLILRVLRTLNSLEPQVDQLMKQVNGEVLPKVSGLADRVDSLAVSVEKLAVSTQGVTDSAKGTMDAVGDRVLAVSDAVSLVASAGASKFEKIAPYVGLLVTGLKLYSQFAAAKPAPKPTEKPKKQLNK